MIKSENDVVGRAISDYYKNGSTEKIKVSTDLAEDDYLDPAYFFRTYNTMPVLERKALDMACGKVLDVGAGAGCHSIWLQEKGLEVHAIDISESACQVMLSRGIHNVSVADIFNFSGDKFDTILFLMNGIGVAKTQEGLAPLLSHIRDLLNVGGTVLIDSSDLIYLYEDEEDGYLIDLNSDHYYGEINYELTYKNEVPSSFPWLFVDPDTLADSARAAGFTPRVIREGTHFDYLMQLS